MHNDRLFQISVSCLDSLPASSDHKKPASPKSPGTVECRTLFKAGQPGQEFIDIYKATLKEFTAENTEVSTSYWWVRRLAGLLQFYIIRKYNRKSQYSVIPRDFNHMKKSADYNNYLLNGTI